ncbi:MFS transporter [Burkholderia multivorans]|uniref:MFS transporter n=1 Tax=Burkholderia multivorans TaxID=87883 RepID=UPI00201A3E74|nr:MFS transporter [Burkholderia multivorans]MCL4665198.1 MFS transporter [Burkholderia multivorans]
MEKSFDGAAGLQAGDVGHTAREANLLPANEAERAALLRRAVFASLVGTAVEWYDYFIFATASTLVFGELFFPGNDPMIGAIKAFAVFGVGFLVRALGGIIFGDVGDRYGRKKALVITFMLMGLSTFLIGLLPTTHSIGLWAPILLVILRLCQGFGVGGEWGGASLVAVEYAPKGTRRHVRQACRRSATPSVSLRRPGALRARRAPAARRQDELGLARCRSCSPSSS